MSNYKQAEQLLKERAFFSINTLSARKTSYNRNNIIYAIDSYNTTVAYIYNDVLYIHDYKFSSTTSKHISIIKNAFCDILPIKKVNTGDFQILANLPNYKVYMQKKFDFGEFQKKYKWGVKHEK